MSSEAPENTQSAALLRSEAYLAETQRLTRTGSFAIEVATQAVTYSSAEHSRLYGFDPARGFPSIEDFFSRIHPDDRARCREVMSQGIRELTDVEVEYRVLVPGIPPRIIHGFGHPVPGASGEAVEIVGTIIDVTERREAEAQLARVGDEQAALRRVATLVAHGIGAEPVFQAVADEARALLDCDNAAVVRFEDDGTVAVMGASNTSRQTGTRLEPDPRYVIASVRATGRAARFDTDDPLAPGLPDAVRAEGIRTALASPIVVDGEVWGTLTVGRTGDEVLPPEAEARLEKLAELIATAVANAESRMALSRLADEQSALRRVATLVARGASPAAVFDAVAAEMQALLEADGGLTMCRYEQDDELTIVAHRGAQQPQLQPGRRIQHDDPHSVTAAVRRTGQPARQDSYTDTHGSIGRVVERLRFRSGVGVPILVDGRVWGVTVANWMGEEPPPPDTERRMAQFGELLDTAIANADGRDQLNASRARLLTTADDVRRRVVRDLHDGAQQRLVHGIVSLKLARRALQDDDGELRSLVEEALEHVELGNAELRELARGILPANLTHSGLRAAIRTVVSRLDLPVRVDVPDRRFPAEVEASAYFTVAEALTNVLKHAEATSAEVTASATDVALRIEVRDDGIGGADPDGAGLLGLRDRAAALGGWVTIESPPDGGTVLAATLPLTRR